MKTWIKRTIIVLLALACFFSWGLALSWSAELSADAIAAKSIAAFYYTGKDMIADVEMSLVSADGGKRERVMTLLRVNAGDQGQQRYFVYFHKPGDVRRMTFMVWKHPGKEDDRWIFIPAVDLVRRISASDKRSSFVGSDFTYEDVSGRDVAADQHRLLGAGRLNGKPVYILESTPKKPVDFTRERRWIDKKTFLPLKEEYYDAQKSLFKVFTADRIEAVQGPDGTYWTVMERSIKNVKSNHSTSVVFHSVHYDNGLNPKDFSERHMRRPPRKWMRSRP